MENIFFIIFVLLDLVYLMIIIDIILSWMTLFWMNFRIEFIKSILEPIYESIRKIIPTTIWPFELAPLIVIFIIYFLRIFTTSLNPSASQVYQQIINF